ncbi:MAG TPA: hypothetical protein VLY04_01895 [Bryobacteraceae bacterium]|nr:hypothetical protein [Bryobacteraceae bacterium]
MAPPQVAQVECAEARRLLDEYSDALKAFHDARSLLRTISPADPRFSAATQARENAFEKLATARRTYWAHVGEHSCRLVAVNRDPEETENRLREDMLQARREFQDAVTQSEEIVHMSRDVRATADGQMAREMAQRMREKAYDRYAVALKRFSVFVRTGQFLDMPSDRR